jgi:ABC-type multidrug transport system fused ATPase/permease subunit
MRLAIAVLCVIAISVLWGGGLGLLGPAGKVLLSDEGLHGWAHATAASARLGISVTQLPTQKELGDGRMVSPVLHVTRVDADGPAAGTLRAGDWLVGVAGETRLLSANAMARRIAGVQPGRPLRLRVYNPNLPDARRMRAATLRPAPPGALRGALQSIVGRIPEPDGWWGRYRLFLGVLVLFAVVTILRNLFRFFQEYLVETAVVRGVIDLRCEAYNAALRMPVTFFSEKGTTDTMSRFIQDTKQLSRGQITLFGKTLAEPGKAIASIVIAMFFSWKLTLLALLAGPPVYFLIRKFGKRMKRASKKALEGWSGILSVLEETLTGIRVVKAYTMEGAERKRFFRANRRLFNQQRRIAKIDAAISPAVETLGLMAAIGAGALAGFWVLNPRNEMAPTDFLALMGCLAAMFDPVRKLSKVFTSFQKSDAAAARIFEVLDAEQQQEKLFGDGPALPRHRESVELRGIRYRYPSAAGDALKDINLRMEAGQTVAIVGPNGCGKTTLVSLLPRLLDPSDGQILIDGRDVQDYSLRSLRRQIGVVTQETVLFHATIRENIAYGLRRPHQDAVMAAAKQAFVDEFVRELPAGYDTMVGERGGTLSGGQRQRIAIARAILRDPAILIFDEATSQVDADSERRIHEAMEKFIEGRTTLLIAHRFATVLQADRIVVINAGRIIDVGTHGELVERCELYRHLYKTQLIDSGG